MCLSDCIQSKIRLFALVFLLIHLFVIQSWADDSSDSVGGLVGEFVTENTNTDIGIEIETKRVICIGRRKGLGLYDGNDRFIREEIFLGENVLLECHYCDQKGVEDLMIPIEWYFKPKFLHTNEREEIRLETQIQLAKGKRKLWIDEENSLKIRNVAYLDAGIYFCKGADSNISKIQFIVDVVDSKSRAKDYMLGNAGDFKKFVKSTISPLNKKLKKASKGIAHSAKMEIGRKKLIYKIEYQWQEWGNCGYFCKKSDRSGMRRRVGECRVSLPYSDDKRGNSTKVKGKYNGAYKRGVLKSSKFGVEYSCYSKSLESFLKISLKNSIASLPTFIENQPCSDCKASFGQSKETRRSKGLSETTFSIKTTQISYKSDSFVILTCTGAGLTSDVEWKKNGKWIRQRALKRERFRVMNTNQLRLGSLAGVGKSDNLIEEYSCYIDGKVVEIFQVHILPSNLAERIGTIIIQTVLLVLLLIWVFLIIFAKIKWLRIRRFKKNSNTDS